MKSYSISQRYKYRGNLTWYGRIAEDGEFSYISLKTKRKSDAQEWLNMMNAARFMPEEIRRKLMPKDRGFDEALPKFLDSVAASKGDDSKTHLAYKYRLKTFREWLDANGIKTLMRFDAEQATNWAVWLSERYAPKSQHEMVRCTSQFCQWAAKIYDLGDYNPFRDVAFPKVPKRAKAFWTPDQIEKILDNAPDPEFRLFWSVMAFAGLRHAEACRFGPSCIQEDGKMRVVGKGDKEAFLPISDRLKAEIKRYGKLKDGMFATARFDHADRCNETLRIAVEAAGYKSDDATNHKWRHSFASNLIRSGVGPKIVQQLMRHEYVRQTLDTYSHLLQDDLEKALNKK